MKRRKFDPKQIPAKTAGELDDRLQLAKGLRGGLMNKVFPDHWSFLLGEIALFSFILLLLTGTFLALFFDPSMEDVVYKGAYTPLRGVEMSKAYASSLDLSFEVRGGLVMRQMHHWAALLFMAAILVHMFRIFFTGAFRKPREINWLIGVVLFNLGFFEGFLGYSLPDDALSGTGLRSGLFQINPIWLFGPYKGEVVSSASQPDWYVMFMDGMVRLFPPWEIRNFGYTIPAAFFPAVLGLGAAITLVAMYPFLERKFTKDKAHHNLLQRPRDIPARTALGAAVIGFYMIMFLSGANDVIADKFDISLNATTWAGRIGAILVPALAYYATYRICLGLQQHDREVLGHGVETGIIKRLPSGKFIEVHQPLAPVDDHGHAELEYGGAPVPKKMNRLGALAPAVKGFFVPVEQPTEAPVSPPVKREEITAGK